jgi:Mannosylglycerate hydrolase MGH1-like glycoside hydrolase domain
MAFFAQNMLDIALELARYDAIYEDLALKFVEHFLWIAAAMDRIGDNQDEMWDEEDGFFYDLLRFPNGAAMRLKVRSLVGLLPFCAVTLFEPEDRFPKFTERIRRFINTHPQLVANIMPPDRPGVQGRHILSILDEKKLRRVLKRMLDEKEFFSPHGIRALSRYHADHPFVFIVHGQEYRVDYLPAESNSGMFGGNSNWRGPVWFPVNALLFRSLLVQYAYYGNEFTIECPTGSGNQMNLFQIASELARRLSSIFLRDENGRRPVYGGNEKFQTDPYWRDHILFHEYFNGDNGAGLGASHQTGWTGLVARLIQLQGWKTGDKMLKEGARSLLNFPG